MSDEIPEIRPHYLHYTDGDGNPQMMQDGWCVDHNGIKTWSRSGDREGALAMYERILRRRQEREAA